MPSLINEDGQPYSIDDILRGWAGWPVQIAVFPDPTEGIYARARRNIRGGWWAEVGVIGTDATERKACFTRRGALWSAWWMRRRWYGS